MRKFYLLLTIGLFSLATTTMACDCGPAYSEESLDNKVYSSSNYIFYTADVIGVQSAFHLEVTLQITEVFYGAKFIKDVTRPITVYFDMRTECAISQAVDIKVGNKLFITSVYNTMGRMFITNNCDAFFLPIRLTPTN